MSDPALPEHHAPWPAPGRACNICDYALLSWTPSLLSRRFGLSGGEIGTVLGAVVVLAGVLGATGAGIVALPAAIVSILSYRRAMNSVDEVVSA